MFSVFHKKYGDKSSEWLSQIKQQLSTKYDTHPSFTERMKAIGIEEFSDELHFVKGDSEYQRESNKIIEKMNRIWAM